MIKKQKNKLHLYFRYIIVSLTISIAIFAAIFYFNVNKYMATNGEQVVYKNDMYTLRGKPTDLQKDLFKELTNQLDKNIEFDFEAVELVVKNFVADYYTWSNKQGAYDVGGSEFVFSKENLNFKQNARRYFYNEIVSFVNDDISISDLIEVESITTNQADFAAEFDHYGTKYLTYYVEATWVYKENANLDITLFPTNASFTLVFSEDGRYEIVRFY